MCQKTEETPWWVFVGCILAGFFVGLVCGVKWTIAAAKEAGAVKWVLDENQDRQLKWSTEFKTP